MQVAFRVDASTEIGSGHVMRCLALADALAQQGASCTFVSRSHPGHLHALIARRGHRVVALAPATLANAGITGRPYATWLGATTGEDAAQTRGALQGEAVGWLIVDHYAINAEWERVVRPLCRKLMVVDDLADRPHFCDLLLDQNLGRSARDYDGLLPPDCERLVGPRFALLRPAFQALRAHSLARRAAAGVRRVLVSMGGVDKDDFTSRVLDALDGSCLPSDCELVVVMGASARWTTEVLERARSSRFPVQILVAADNMAELMAGSDIAIGAAGSTSWERCVLGVPTVMVVQAANQTSAAAALRDAGAVIVVQPDGDFSRAVAQAVSTLAEDALQRGEMSARAAALCDGSGLVTVSAYLVER